MNQRDARQLVRELVALPPRYRAETIATGSAAHPEASSDALKAAQYALLVPAVHRGVQDLLTLEGYRRDHGATNTQIADRVGRDLHDAVAARLHQDEPTHRLVSELADRRASRLSAVEHAAMVASFDQSLRSASLSAAHASVLAAETVAYVIRAQPMVRTAGQRPPPPLVAVVRDSAHLPLTHQMVHLEDHALVNLVLRSHNYLAAQGRTHPERLLRYERERVVLARSISHWHLSPTLTIGDVAGRHADVRIGCPFTFAPARLRVQFYQLLVDLTRFE